ncbi:MAG: DUF362 domain-containing protein [Chitinispirillaceae bacterium]|nr:DUF362 domain-containing protein [Chitinispirillaceae bacterium]
MKLSRRSFLKSSAASTVAAAASSKIVRAAQGSSSLSPGPGNKWPGRVVINFNKNAVDSVSKPVPSVIRQMVDDAILRLTDQSSIGAAWKAIFPSSLTAQSKIAIKVFCAEPRVPTHWSSIRAITDGLQQMDFNGTKFPASNIAIYEGNASNRFSEAEFTAANFPGIKLEYWAPGRFVDGGDGAFSNRPYAGTLKGADFLINVFNPRGHSVGSTFTIGFKSHFGTYELNTSKTGDLHNNAAQNLRDMHCIGPVFKKNVLSVCSGILGMNESIGPTGSAQSYLNYTKTIDPSSTCQCPATIIMSTDPVSCEMQTVKMMRLNKSPAGKYGVNDMPTYLRASAGVSGALSGTTYNIGIIDESKMDIRRIINGTTDVGTPVRSRVAQARSRISVSSLPGSKNTFIEYLLPPDRIGKKAVISIHTLKGVTVHEHELPIPGRISHYAWDNRDRRGKPLTPGKYVVRITAGAVRLSADFSIIK